MRNLEKIITTMIDKQTPNFAEKAVRLYRKSHQENDDVKQLKEKLTNLFLDYAALVMAEILAYIHDEYGINVSPLSEEELTAMFYSKDGKTFVDRIDEYVKEDDVITFTYKFYRFMRTETIVLANSLLFQKLKNEFKYVRVNLCNCCGGCGEVIGILASWTLCTNVNITDLPPWHPECHCTVEFSNEKHKELSQDEM